MGGPVMNDGGGANFRQSDQQQQPEQQTLPVFDQNHQFQQPLPNSSNIYPPNQEVPQPNTGCHQINQIQYNAMAQDQHQQFSARSQHPPPEQINNNTTPNAWIQNPVGCPDESGNGA